MKKRYVAFDANFGAQMGGVHLEIRFGWADVKRWDDAPPRFAMRVERTRDCWSNRQMVDRAKDIARANLEQHPEWDAIIVEVTTRAVSRVDVRERTPIAPGKRGGPRIEVSDGD